MVGRAEIESTETQKSPFPKGLKVDSGRETTTLVRAREEEHSDGGQRPLHSRHATHTQQEKSEKKGTLKNGPGECLKEAAKGDDRKDLCMRRMRGCVWEGFQRKEPQPIAQAFSAFLLRS